MDEKSLGLWVGRIKNKGNVLYDPAIQIPSSPLVYLFVLDRKGPGIESFRRYDVKQRLEKPTQGQQTAINHVYEAWKKKNSDEFIANEIARIERYRSRIAQANQQWLESKGLPYYGVKNNVNDQLRTTVCVGCHKEIDNHNFLECIHCGWIVCKCGACGCEYKAREYLYTKYSDHKSAKGRGIRKR